MTARPTVGPTPATASRLTAAVQLDPHVHGRRRSTHTHASRWRRSPPAAVANFTFQLHHPDLQLRRQRSTDQPNATYGWPWATERQWLGEDAAHAFAAEPTADPAVTDCRGQQQHPSVTVTAPPPGIAAVGAAGVTGNATTPPLLLHPSTAYVWDRSYACTGSRRIIRSHAAVSRDVARSIGLGPPRDDGGGLSHSSFTLTP